jgi:YesN/AraC family two-component response regulator
MVVISGFLLRGTFKKLISRVEKLNYDDFMMLSVFSGILIIWIAYFTASYTSYITGALSFSFTLYLSISVLVYQRKRKFTTIAIKEKYASNKISSEEAKSLVQKIEKTINDQSLFKNPNLTLPQLAKTVNIRQHRLSQLLNDNLEKSFTQFINEFRIEEAKKLLKTESNLKMEIIAEKSGFNSNSTFYTAFKKITNTTPAKYLND